MLLLISTLLFTILSTSQEINCSFNLHNKTNNKEPELWHVSTLEQDQANEFLGSEYCFNFKIHIINKTDGTGGVNINDVVTEMNETISIFSDLGINLLYENNTWNGEVTETNNDYYFYNPIQLLGSPLEDSSVINFYFHNYTNPNPDEQIPSGSSPESTEVLIYGGQLNDVIISHEIGHQFGLMHTFHGTAPISTFPEEHDDFDVTENDTNGCCAGDWVKDTPADNGSFHPETGIGSGLNCNDTDPTTGMTIDATNYMTNSHYTCRDSFTKGQITRMKYIIERSIGEIEGIPILPHLNDALTCFEPVEGNCNEIEAFINIALYNFINYDQPECSSATITFLEEFESEYGDYVIGYSWNNGANSENLSIYNPSIDVTFDSTNTNIEITSLGHSATVNGSQVYTSIIINGEFVSQECPVVDLNTTCEEENCNDCQDVAQTIAGSAESISQFPVFCGLWRVYVPADYDNCYTTTIDWGDNSPEQELVENPNNPSVNHDYEPGCYTITATTTLTDGSFCTATYDIEVCDSECESDDCGDCDNLQPNFQFTYNENGCPKTLKAINDGDDCEGLNYLWEIYLDGDLAFSTNQEIFTIDDFDFSQEEGNYVIELTLIGGASEDCQATIVVPIDIPSSCYECIDCKYVSDPLNDSLILGDNCIASIDIPIIEGCVNGYIVWGDGTYEDLISNSTMTHQYANGVYYPLLVIYYENGKFCTRFSKTFDVNCKSSNLENLKLIPNPSKQNQELQFEGINYKEVIGIEVLDIYGNPKVTMKPKRNAFNTGQLTSGVYFVRFTTSKGTITKKLIIE